MTVTRLILADDHPLLLRGVADLISFEPDFEVVATAGSGHEALAALEQMRPDLLVLDINMPDLTGLAVLRAIHRSDLHVRVIFLTAAITPRQITEALALGAWGLLLKESASDLLIDCMRAVVRGEHWHPQELLARADPERAAPDPLQLAQLTLRERQVVTLVCKGLSNKAIAEQVGTAQGTIKIHLNNIFRKLGLSNRTSLAALALTLEERGEWAARAGDPPMPEQQR